MFGNVDLVFDLWLRGVNLALNFPGSCKKNDWIFDFHVKQVAFPSVHVCASTSGSGG